MNLTEFMKKVDKISGNMSAESMAAFLHDHARGIPEHQRAAFIERLSFYDGKNVDADYTEKQDNLNKEQIIQAIRKNRERLELIDDGELTLVEILNEEYDDWYGEGEEFFYEDPENIGETIQESCDLVHTCVDAELYQEAYDLADFLLVMEVEAEGEYDGNNFSLHNLAYEKIISLDYEKFVMEALLAAYWGNDPEERPEALYDILFNSSSREASLEKLMQQSRKELDQFQEFLRLWIEYLGERDDKIAEGFLQEAVLLADDPEILLSSAREFRRLHPELYVQVLEQYRAKEQYEKGLEIGKEAMGQILSVYQARSQAALLTAEFALRLNDREYMEKCWLEAFRSDSSMENYLRLILECRDYQKQQKAAEEIYTALYTSAESKTPGYFQLGERSTNYMGRRGYYSMLFFGGKFHQVIEEAMNEKDGVGWSGTFMKEGLALFLLLLYEGKELSKGCNEMCRNYVYSIGFNAEKYRKGTDCGTELDNQTFFWECFLQWRKHVTLSEQEARFIIEKLEKWIQLRVAGIMGNNRRKYYGECAAFIAALGEVKESRGEPGGKAVFMEEYRSAYSRRTAFHEELRAYGMRDNRKRK